MVTAFGADCLRGDFSNDFTVPLPIVRGRLIPTFTSQRNPARGLLVALPCRSRLESIDFNDANRRRIVRGFTIFMIPSHCCTRLRSTDMTETSASILDAKT